MSAETYDFFTGYQKQGRPTRKPDDKVLAELLKTHSKRDIAIFYGVAPSTVRSWLCRSRKQAERRLNDSNRAGTGANAK